MRTTMKDLRLSRHFQIKVLYKIMSISLTRFQHEELQRFMNSLSPSVKARVIKDISESALKASPNLYSIRDKEELSYKLTLIDKTP